ncbi:MAG TPA: flagellar hook-length control protein FliK [Eoetvoesiella sp.]
MSIGGPSALGTLLVQRLDAVLGTTLSQQTNIVSGARPDAVTQPDRPQRPDAAQNETLRHPRESVEKATAGREQQIQQAVDKTKIDARQALLAGRPAPNTASTPSAPTTLGTAARTILALLANYPDQAPAIIGKTPLATPAVNASVTGATSPAGGTTASANAASTPATEAGASTGPQGTAVSRPPGAVTASVFMQALSQALQNSGLFYESHLNNVAFGKQSPASLMQEPQAQLGRATQPAVNSAPGSQASALPPEGNTGSHNMAARAEAAPTGAAPTTTASPALPQTSPLAGLHPETHLLVRQQLEVLANQTLVWRGEAWPNTPLEWEVHRRQSSPGETGSTEHEHWATRLKITLPNLGEVEARLNLVNQQVIMHLVAPGAANLLSENGEQLRAQCLASGLQLSQLSINSEASTHTPDTETGHDL